FFFQAEDGIRDRNVTGVQTCALPISGRNTPRRTSAPADPIPPRRPPGPKKGRPAHDPEPRREPRRPDRDRARPGRAPPPPGVGLDRRRPARPRPPRRPHRRLPARSDPRRRRRRPPMTHHEEETSMDNNDHEIPVPPFGVDNDPARVERLETIIARKDVELAA